MNLSMTITSTGLVWLLAGPLLAAQDGKPEAEKSSPAAPIVRIGALHGKHVKSDSQDLGAISDFVIDLRSGHLSLILTVGSERPSDGDERLALPVSAVVLDSGRCRLKSTVTTQQLAAGERFVTESSRKSFHREAVGELFSAFGSEPPWRLTVPDQYDPRDKFPRWSELRERRVYDKLGAVAGDIEGFGISPDDGRIAYAALDQGPGATQRRKLYAIPLAAFVVPDVDKPWKLELTQLDVREMEAFPRERWPSEVSRGWAEYVRVRYGQAARSGVQTEESGDRG